MTWNHDPENPPGLLACSPTAREESRRPNMGTESPLRGDERRRATLERRLRLYDCFEQTLPPQLGEQFVLPSELQPLSREQAIEFWAPRQRSARPVPHVVQFYLHVPFCRTQCRFCQFPSELLRGPAQPERFVNAIEQEMNAFKSSLGAVPVDCLAIGGGTPSLLSTVQLVRILRAIRSLVTCPVGAYFSVECNPDSTTRSLVDALADHEVTRISLGVQSFDTEVLRQAGRGYQTQAQVVTALDAVRQRGLSVSLDLIAPLPGETITSFAAGVRRALELTPDMIVLYWFQPPTSGATNQAKGVLDCAQARDILLHAASAARYDVLPQSGPSVVLKRAGVPEPSVRYQQRRTEPSSTYAFGPHAWSHVAGIGTYISDGGIDEPVTYRGVRLDPSREARSTIIRRFETRQPLERSAFRNTFGQDAVAMLPAEIAYLSEARRVTVTDRTIEPNFSEQRDARRHSWVLFDEAFMAAALVEAALPRQRALAAAIAAYEKLTGGVPRPRVRELQRKLSGPIAPTEASAWFWHRPARTGPHLEVWLEPLALEPSERARALEHFLRQILPPTLQPVAPVVARLDAARGLAKIGVEVRADTGDSVSLRLRFAATPSCWLQLIDAALSMHPLTHVSPEVLRRMAELRLGIGPRDSVRREGVFLLNSEHAYLRVSRHAASARVLAELAHAGAVVAVRWSDKGAALEIEAPAHASSVLEPILAPVQLDSRRNIGGFRLRIAVAGGHLNWHSMAVATVV